MGEPVEHAILVVDSDLDLPGFTGDLCELGVTSFLVENSGGSLLDISAGTAGATCTVNIWTQGGTVGGRWGPFGFDSENGLRVATGQFLQITANTEFGFGEWWHQIFFGRITQVEAIHDSYKSPNPVIDWERGWTITATSLAVDLSDHGLSGTTTLPSDQLEDRIAEILARAGSWWPVVPIIEDLEGLGAPIIGSCSSIAAADWLDTVQGEIDRAATSCWAWWTWVRNPWLWDQPSPDYDIRGALRIVYRESVWRPAGLGMRGRDGFQLIGDPFPESPDRYGNLEVGLRIRESNDNYLQEVEVIPKVTSFNTWNITGDDRYGSRKGSFSGHVGVAAGRSDSDAPGAPPSGTGGAGWIIATSWASSTTESLLTFENMTWKLTDDSQSFNGQLLDLDRLDPLWLVWDGDIIPLRIRNVRVTAIAHDWRVSVDCERVDPYTTWDYPTS